MRVEAILEMKRAFPYRAALLIAATFQVALAAHLQAENWPRFRGPTGQGVSSETSLPAEWSSTSGIAWKTEIPGESWSSPIVWNDQVFVTTATDGGRSCRVLALDRKAGRVLWNTEVFQQTPGHKQGKNSYATPTPVTDGERVYAVFGDGSVAAVNFDGSLAWTNRDVKFYSEHGLGASPLVYGELLIMAFDGSSPGPETKVGWQIPWDQAFILAVDKTTGKPRWRASRGLSRIAHISPAVIRMGDREELLSCAGDAIQGFNPKTGQRLWHVFSEGEGVVPSPAWGDGLIFTASGFGKSTIRAVRMGARDDATKTHIAWEQRKGVPSQSSLLYVKPFLYAVTEGGIASCVKSESGDIVWQQRIGGEFCASPVFGDGKVFFLSEQGDTTVVAPGAEFKQLARNTLGERCQASPAVSQEHLFIRSDKHLWCIGK